MSLVSNTFLLLVAAAVFLYYLAPARFRWMVLLAASFVYYYAGGGFTALFYIVYSILTVYTAGRLLDRLQLREDTEKAQKAVVTIGLVLNFAMLAIVKYSGAFIGFANHVLGLSLPGFEILFPLGISFYTFQSSGYLLDVYWKKAKAETNVFRFALFVSFFPQLMQGPIGNFNRLAPQLTEPHCFEWDNLIRGLERMVWGFAKKIIIADWAGVFADAIWADPDTYGGIVFFGLIFYGIQLYADFSGAMDVVIGIAELFGIKLDENFRRPYLATSMADFWKRWHITLGDWMMNYVFYPISLSGWMMKFSKWSRKKFGRQYGRVIPIALADLLVFLLVGIWHGCSWKYVVYGLLNGGIIAFSELMTYHYRKWRQALHIAGDETWFRLFTIVRTFILVNLRWFYDRSDTLAEGNYLVKQAFTHWEPSQLFQIAAGSQGTAFVPWALLIIFVGCVLMVGFGVMEERGADLKSRLRAMPWYLELGLVLGLFLMIGLFGSTAAPRGFIYAQF